MNTRDRVGGAFVIVWCLLSATACDGGPGGPDAADGESDGDVPTADDASHEVPEVSDDGGDVPPEVVALPAECGDHIIQLPEECDDGNRMNGDGCDWLCRRGDGAFDYPDPDPAVPPVADAGTWPAVEEGSAFPDAHVEFQLVWGGSSYALAYPTADPILTTRVRLLDRLGVNLAEPWERLEAFVLPELQLVPWDGGFVLLSKQTERGILKAVGFDASLAVVFDTRAVADAPVEPAGLRLHAAASASSMAVGYAIPAGDWGGGWLLQLLEGAAERALPPQRFAPHDLFSGFNQLLALPGGFAVTNGLRLVRLDAELAVVGWTGVLPAEDPRPDMGRYARNVARTEDGLLFFWPGSPDVAAGPGDLWSAVIALDGRLHMPPRVTWPRAVAVGGANPRVAYGPAGALVGWWSWSDELADDALFVLNTDRNGSPCGEPQVAVTGAECGGSGGTFFEVAADDLGYVVAVVGQRSTGEHYLLVRRFAPAP